MSDIKFTEEQLAIIGGEVSNVLVSAAAGSGKTTVLVERIIRQIVEGTLSIDKLLVVTFTNDAANHMAEKIEKALNDRIKSARSTGDDELASRLTEQLNLIPNSYIQTIDSFCSRVLKEKGHLINTPEERDVFASGNVILDESNLSLILNRAANLAVMEMYLSNPGEDSPFIKLTNRFGNGRTDDALVSAVVDAFKNNQKYTPKDCSGLSCQELFGEIEDIFNLRKDDELTYDATVEKIRHLFNCNSQIFCKKNVVI